MKWVKWFPVELVKYKAVLYASLSNPNGYRTVVFGSWVNSPFWDKPFLCLYYGNLERKINFNFFYYLFFQLSKIDIKPSLFTCSTFSITTQATLPCFNLTFNSVFSLLHFHLSTDPSHLLSLSLKAKWLRYRLNIHSYFLN